MESALAMEIDSKDFFVGLVIGGVGAVLVPFSFMALTGAAAVAVLYGGSAATLGGFGWALKDGPIVYKRSGLRKLVKGKILELESIMIRFRERVVFVVRAYKMKIPPP